MTGFQDVRDFVSKQGYVLEKEHFSGKCTCGNPPILREPLRNAIEAYEEYYVVIHKVGCPKSSFVKRVIRYSTTAGVQFEWGSESLN